MRGRKCRLMGEINVVPYIDVMLVLLVIFMITAPLLNLGVEVDLPDTAAAPIASDELNALVVSVDRRGDYYLTTDGRPELIDGETLVTKLQAFVRNNPDLEVLVGGDQETSYGQVYQAMVLLQQAGVRRVGLLSDPPPAEAR